MWLGIDFGTTNTSAARFDGDKLTYIPLDPQNSSSQNLRSILYINRRHQVRVGVEAVQKYLDEDTGRPVTLEDKVVGTIENTVARQERGISDADDAITIVYDVVISDDVGIRGRLLQSVKTGLRSASYEGTQVFDKFYAIEELIAFLLRRVKQKAEQSLGQEVHHAVIGRPVTFSHDDEVDRRAEERIRRAAKLAGFNEVCFMLEPVAAATYYVSNLRSRKTILVFDFGGGTLDLTVLKSTRQGGQELLASVGVLVGGDDLDSAIMRGKVAPCFGTRSSIDTNYDGRPIPFPETMAEFLHQWQTIPMLTRPNYLPTIERAIRYGDNPGAFRALETLATHNYGFALFQQIEKAKCELSAQSQAAIDLQMEQVTLHIELSRDEFNTLVAPERTDVRSGIRAVIAQAGLRADEIDEIVATGGSSSIPTFRALLRAEIPAAKIVDSNLFGSVTGGLAMHAYTLQKRA